ncbi:hypothetical protein NEUTE1DRAFT_77816 [Neurospora tetrasperma FGSC 2508]|uniref:C2H2-type domain-containing protein n=1 Tax=Neurospora tetrasperma (strain FGSC 2508 / ATCC MYA-4615 / P0657) TaxID=510951 RepID=F8MEQ1_NEUT8|nr:uncharacterized protein NEUTE1DRAFT_77816 [Neurospora tetrasperma FGSC 2508]EGO61680.1 hypothetical protein NEUTE1DRAFT_77816 [Neurospora tetrasperma FGSC 2508]EGZ74268.1 hypothetical protein NEUTE2DRAFT_155050 [Neurospora tetrasperma FGSC 2509]
MQRQVLGHTNTNLVGYLASGPNKHAHYGHGALFPENYAPRPGRPNAKWHCPIIGCNRAFRLLRDLGEHFNTDHKGDILHDLRDGNFRKIGNAGNRPPYVGYRSDNPPSPIPLPPPSPPKRPAADNSSAGAGAVRTATPGLFFKQEYSDDDDARPKETSYIILDHESDEWQESNSDNDDPDSADGKEDTDSDSDESEHTENENIVQQREQQQFSDSHIDNDDYSVHDHGSDIWAYLNSLTPEPIAIPDDACIKELMKLPVLRELPFSWKARLSKKSWVKKYCSLKTITAIMHFLVGEDRDRKVCNGLGCDTLGNDGLISALSDFAIGSDGFHGEYAFPRCIMLPDNTMMSEAVMERIGINQCVNAYYRRGKKVPFPGRIFPRRLEVPQTPKGRGNNRPYSESSVLRRQARLPSLSVTPSRSPKRKASSPEYEDELPSYRLANPSSPNKPAPWEQFTGFLPLRSSPPRGHRSSQAASDVMVAHSSMYLASQPQKRIKLVDHSGLGRGDFAVLTLAGNDDGHVLRVDQGSGRMLNCSVAKGRVDVFLVVRGRGQAQEEMTFTAGEDTQWVVKEGWACEVTKFQGEADEAKVHVTGLGVDEQSQE